MKLKTTFSSALASGLLWAATSASALAAPGELKEPEITETRLSNGLTLLLSRDTSLPQVAVEIRFLSGSASERKGLEGFAHLFEHLMFQGSEHYNQDYFAPYEAIGGLVNGTTSQDRTNFFEQVPSSHLELALWMESDRVQTLLNVLTEERFENQRSVVLNERRQRYENTPYGMMYPLILENLFPEGHPYHHPTIGYPEALNQATLDDARQFFSNYYSPSNAVLAIVGDIDLKEARQMVERYFGDWKNPSKPEQPSAPIPVLDADRHVVEQDNISLPQVNLAWVTPVAYSADDAALDLWALILTDGKSSRLYQDLIFEQHLLQDLWAFQASDRLAGAFMISATAAPGHSIDEIAQALDRSLEKALSTPPTEEELKRALNAYRKAFFKKTEGVLKRAHQLTQYWHITGKASYLKEDLARYTNLTPADLAQAARWLKAHRVRVDFIPRDGGDQK